jgi:hypothetical protein
VVHYLELIFEDTSIRAAQGACLILSVSDSFPEKTANPQMGIRRSLGWMSFELSLVLAGQDRRGNVSAINSFQEVWKCLAKCIICFELFDGHCCTGLLSFVFT